MKKLKYEVEDCSSKYSELTTGQEGDWNGLKRTKGRKESEKNESEESRRTRGIRLEEEEFSRSQESRNRGTCSNYSVSAWLKANRPKHHIYPHQ